MGTSNLIGSGETYRMKYDSLSRDAIKYCLLPPRSSSARFLFDSGCLVGMRNRRRFSLFSLPRLVSRSATLTPTHCRFFLHFHFDFFGSSGLQLEKSLFLVYVACFLFFFLGKYVIGIFFSFLFNCLVEAVEVS